MPNIYTTRPDVLKFISSYLQASGRNPQAELRHLEYDAWSFSEDQKTSSRLINLVLDGVKTATAGLYALDQKIPRVGSLGVIMDHNDRPRCLIEYASVAVHSFLDVSWNFAQAEGEGFTSIEHWRTEHQKVFDSWGQKCDDSSKIVCTYFRLLYPAPTPLIIV